MIDKEEKTFEETIVAGNMDEAKKIAKESNPEAKIVSANWVYKQISSSCKFIYRNFLLLIGIPMITYSSSL